jgi:hypothetical protein
MMSIGTAVTMVMTAFSYAFSFMVSFSIFLAVLYYLVCIGVATPIKHVLLVALCLWCHADPVRTYNIVTRSTCICCEGFSLCVFSEEVMCRVGAGSLAFLGPVRRQE